jgi:hypothetical protein
MAFQFTLRNFITVPANAALDVGRGDGFTFEAWMHPNRSDTGGSSAGDSLKCDWKSENRAN